jgi:NADP-dependent 3-hydroxy acid dehydrogenase YdfG
MRRVADSRETAVRVAAQFGGIDVLFVNAGVGGFAPVSEVTEEFWDGVHQVNRRGASPEEVVRMRTIMQNAVPMQRLGEATFITGIDLFVDGGCVES